MSNAHVLLMMYIIQGAHDFIMVRLGVTASVIVCDRRREAHTGTPAQPPLSRCPLPPTPYPASP